VLESAYFQRFELQYDDLLSKFAYNFNLRPYTLEAAGCAVRFGVEAEQGGNLLAEAKEWWAAGDDPDNYDEGGTGGPGGNFRGRG